MLRASSILVRYVYGTTIKHNYEAGWVCFYARGSHQLWTLNGPVYIEQGVMTLSSWDVFQYSRILPGAQTLAIGQILINETDPLFAWYIYPHISRPIPSSSSRLLSLTYSDITRQYNDSAPCPNGCVREASASRGGTICTDPTNSTSSKREVVFGSGVHDHIQACEMGGFAGSHIGHDHGL